MKFNEVELCTSFFVVEQYLFSVKYRQSSRTVSKQAPSNVDFEECCCFFLKIRNAFPSEPAELFPALFLNSMARRKVEYSES
jgi:hypothetical protein